MILFLFLSFVFANDRIVSLNPTLTEILFEMDLGKSVVGTTTFSNYPEAAKEIKTVGSYAKPQLEKIIELKPTHVVAFIEGDPEIVSGLTRAKMPLHAFASRSLDDYPKLLESLGSLFNKRERAKILIDNWNTSWKQIGQIKISKNALIQVDHNPLFVAGGDSFISESFSRCGIENIFKSQRGYKTVQMEALKGNKPQLIFFVGNVPNQDLISDIHAFWRENPLTKEVPVIIGDADTLSRLGPRLPEGVLNFCKQVRSAL